MGCVLVVGGAGYIGSHTVYSLVEDGYNVLVLDNLSTGFREAIHKNAKFYEGDIKDEDFLEYIFKKEDVDSVIHFAAFSRVEESMKCPFKYYENNVIGTKTLVESMIKNNVKDIVFSSTAAVYGNGVDGPIDENQNKEPTNCYGDTKLTIENMLKWTGFAYGLRYVCLRYFNACGAHKKGLIGESHKNESHLIPLVLQVALKQREYISIFGTDYKTKDGSAVRDYVHVLDLAKAHILAIEYLKNGGQSDIFNLGNGVGFSVKEIIKAAENVTKTKINFKEEKRRAGDPAILVACSNKAKKILNWEPEFKDIEQIIKTAYLWHKNNPNGFIT